VERFVLIRERMMLDKQGAGKQLSTSELIDWLRRLTQESERSLTLLRPADAPLPFASALLKTPEDLKYREPPSRWEGAP
jgi:hypothetical protein